MLGTKVLMITSFLSISIVVFLHKKPDPSQIVTVVLIQLMGAITLLSNDSTFIKMKPTVLYVLLATGLMLGLCFKRYFIKSMLESILELDENGWKKVTVSWALYFTICALANELVWRNFSEDFWVSFKVFAFIPITLIFTCFQLFSLRKYMKS